MHAASARYLLLCCAWLVAIFILCSSMMPGFEAQNVTCGMAQLQLEFRAACSSPHLIFCTLPVRAAGGAVYTWGGDFSWAEPADVRAAQDAAAKALMSAPVTGPLGLNACGSASTLGGSGGSGAVAAAVSVGRIPKDHHRGCLGTGDREGRLLPTRVRGELEGKEVVQVRLWLGAGAAVEHHAVSCCVCLCWHMLGAAHVSASCRLSACLAACQQAPKIGNGQDVQRFTLRAIPVVWLRAGCVRLEPDGGGDA